MMTRVLILFLAGAALVIAQPSPQNIQLVAPGPAAVSAGSAAVSGTAGFQTYVYFVVARYTRGAVYPQVGFSVTNAPGTLSGSNFVALNWSGTGATTYDVLRTTDGVFPSGATCTCAVSTGVTSPAVNDQSNTLTSYTLPTAALGASASLYLDATNTTLGNSLRLLVDGVQSGQLAGIGLGSNTQMYFNDAGTPTATSGLTWNKSTNVHSIVGSLNVSNGGTPGYSLFGVTTTANGAGGGASDNLYSGVSTDGTVTRRGLTAVLDFTGTSNSGNAQNGAYIAAATTPASSGNLTASNGSIVALRTQVTHRGLGTITYASSVTGSVSNVAGAGTVTDAAVYEALSPTIAAATTYTNYYGLHVRGGAVTGTLTNRYGVRVDTLTGGTTKWAFYAQTDPSFFGGAVTMGAAVYGPVNAVTFSATPNFDLSLGDPTITLTANITSFTVTNITAGQRVNFKFCQNGAGAWTVAGAPASVHGFFAIGATASLCSVQAFESFDGTNLFATTAGVINQ